MLKLFMNWYIYQQNKNIFNIEIIYELIYLSTEIDHWYKCQQFDIYINDKTLKERIALMPTHQLSEIWKIQVWCLTILCQTPRPSMIPKIWNWPDCKFGVNLDKIWHFFNLIIFFLLSPSGSFHFEENTIYYISVKNKDPLNWMSLGMVLQHQILRHIVKTRAQSVNWFKSYGPFNTQ